MSSIDQLKQLIHATLSPQTQKEAEAQLKVAQTQPGFTSAVLQVVAQTSTAPADQGIRQAAAVLFKNAVKKAWDPAPVEEGEADLTEGIRIDQNERHAIKENLVQLMCTTPPMIQSQLSEAIALIANSDYHQKWTSLMPSLVRQFESPETHVMLGALSTAHSVCKMFRYIGRSDELYLVIQYTLSVIAAPLLALMKKLGQGVADPVIQQNKKSLETYMQAIYLVCRIYYSLVYQDLPEYFEDHFGEWMVEFDKFLQPNIFPILEDPDEEDSPSELNKVQGAIVDALAHFEKKDEEVFVEKHLHRSTTLVWEILMRLTNLPKHDSLATKSIRFLSGLVMKPAHKTLFAAEGVLASMVEKIVIPNLYFRESDQENFEDNPHEFMVTEIEGADSESRRTCVQELLRNMCRNLEQETIVICQRHVDILLQEFATNPNEKWASKDVAIHLFMSMAIRREGLSGVAEITPNIDLLGFLQSQILPELQDANHENRPVVKAAAIKFVSTFRKQFSREESKQILPIMIAHLNSPVVVVHTFAAHTIERLLVTKDETVTPNVPKVGQAELQPFLDPLFQGLFSIIEKTELNENDYVMKCIMRSLVTARQQIVPVTEVVVTKLTAALERVARNPRNPQYNHCLFESLAILIKYVCVAEPTAVNSFEAVFVAPFSAILQADIAEFTPYVFQLFAQLLEFRPQGSGLTEFYTSFFSMLKHPGNWEKRGNIPALARLVVAYIQHAPNELQNDLIPILGIFQKLMSLKATEAQGVQIVNAVISSYELNVLQQYLREIMNIFLTRLKKTPQAPKLRGIFVSFLGILTAKHGGAAAANCLESISNGLTKQIVEFFWSETLFKDPPRKRVDAKIQIIGVTRFLTDNPSFLEESPKAFTLLVAGVVKILSADWFVEKAGTEGLDDADIIDVSYDNQFAELKFSRPVSVQDPLAGAAAFDKEFFGCVSAAAQRHPGGRVAALLNELDPKALEQFQRLLQTHGFQIA